MKNIKTYESFFNLFNRKKKDTILPDAIDRISIDKMRDIMMELEDDYDIDINEKIKYATISKEKLDRYSFVCGMTENGEKYYFTSKGITKESANCYQIALRNITDDNFVDGNNLKDDRTLFDKFDTLLRQKSEINDFKYLIFKDLILSASDKKSSQRVNNLFIAIIY